MNTGSRCLLGWLSNCCWEGFFFFFFLLLTFMKEMRFSFFFFTSAHRDRRWWLGTDIHKTELVLKWRSFDIMFGEYVRKRERERLFLFSEIQCLMKRVFAALPVSGRNKLHAVEGTASLKMVSFQPSSATGCSRRGNAVSCCVPSKYSPTMFPAVSHSQETSGCFVFSKSRCVSRF